MKNKNHIIISIDAEKAYPPPFDNKTLNRLGLEGNVTKLIKGSYEKCIANCILNGQSLKAYPKIRNKRDICYSLSN